MSKEELFNTSSFIPVHPRTSYFNPLQSPYPTSSHFLPVSSSHFIPAYSHFYPTFSPLSSQEFYACRSCWEIGRAGGICASCGAPALRPSSARSRNSGAEPREKLIPTVKSGAGGGSHGDGPHTSSYIHIFSIIF